jgi:hypothetical protein
VRSSTLKPYWIPEKDFQKPLANHSREQELKLMWLVEAEHVRPDYNMALGDQHSVVNHVVGQGGAGPEHLAVGRADGEDGLAAR